MELLGGEYIDVLKPLRIPKLSLIQPEHLKRSIELAVDADHDLPCLLGPRLLEIARVQRSDADVACVVANVEYETWFVASAGSLADYLNLAGDEILPAAPEAARLGKGWIQRRRHRYSETIDQPGMTRAMDLAECRSKSSSFDKLCRDLEARLQRK